MPTSCGLVFVYYQCTRAFKEKAAEAAALAVINKNLFNSPTHSEKMATESKKRADDLQERYNDLYNDNTTLQNRLEEEKKAHKDSKEQYEGQIIELKGQLQDAHAETANATSGGDEAKKEAARLEAQKRQLEKELDDAHIQAQEAADTRINMQQTISSNLQQINEYKAEIDTLKHQLREFDTLKDAHRELLGEKNAYMEELELVTERLNELNSSARDMEELNAQMSNEIEKKNNEVEGYRENIATLRRRIADLDKSRQELLEQLKIHDAKTAERIRTPSPIPSSGEGILSKSLADELENASDEEFGQDDSFVGKESVEYADEETQTTVTQQLTIATQNISEIEPTESFEVIEQQKLSTKVQNTANIEPIAIKPVEIINQAVPQHLSTSMNQIAEIKPAARQRIIRSPKVSSSIIPQFVTVDWLLIVGTLAAWFMVLILMGQYFEFERFNRPNMRLGERLVYHIVHPLGQLMHYLPGVSWLLSASRGVRHTSYGSWILGVVPVGWEPSGVDGYLGEWTMGLEKALGISREVFY
jgi:myosin heavy subunit